MSNPPGISPRVATALVGIPLVGAVVYFGGIAFFLVTVGLALVSLNEIEGAARTFKVPLVAPVAYPALILVLLAPYYTGSTATSASQSLVPWLPWLVLVALLVAAVALYASPRRLSLLSLSLTLFAVFYVGLFTFLPLLRNLPQGHALMWLTLLGVWTGDTVAYYAGGAFGRNKLTPLSPGKTREGLLAGLAGTIVTCLMVAIVSHLRPVHGVALGLLIGISAPLGDLAESFWKRELGVKDLGSLLPGHGGVLDRCDSLLFATFVVYCYVVAAMG